MKTISSFTVDHNRLMRGVYVSRRDTMGAQHLTTFDIRMKLPNREPVLDVPALHTIEHLGATFLRNHDRWADETIYFGPMGCRTGCYAIFKGRLESSDIIGLLTELFEYIAAFEGEVPGATASGCGNWLSQDLPMARLESERFAREVLRSVTPENTHYPC
ncbi:S-ribosylhomocysteine lyase [Myxococcota bacterium]|nr:S-ribosylhomocysteine lyase [Myxococcota bacterium]MBU1536478.1 S-ribosylhomocysteine lyase [Myxococcota bacterium]